MSGVALAGRRVVVVGLRASGRAAATLAARLGARVVGVDLATDVPPIPGVTLELGPHRRQTFLEAELILVSPGVPAAQPDLAAAAAAGVPVLGELAFAAEQLAAPLVAITGTNGKSTVTHFTGQLLAAAGARPFVGGNLGSPLCNELLAQRDGAPASDVLVVEVSSYQLEWPGALRPKVAVVLNLTPDHLARHGDMDNYGRHKLRLFAGMGPDDLGVLPADDARLARLDDGGRGGRAWLGRYPGVVREGRRATVRLPSREATFDLSGIRVPGEHNLDNAATALLLATALGYAPAALQAGLGDLRALPHRMEVVAEQGGVTWINDSKATNVEAAAVGIGGLDRRAVVLLGGEAKGPGFVALAPLLARHRAVITFGGSGAAIADELAAAGVAVIRAGALSEAVSTARGLARSGDAVLLSPGCASFDAFQNFEHRGRVFGALAREEAP